jgi:DNA mismatch endonuclease (patch repair protein)
MPSTNVMYWEGKIARNVTRDKNNLTALRAAGWKTVIIWECELSRGAERLLRLLEQVRGKDS